MEAFPLNKDFHLQKTFESVSFYFGNFVFVRLDKSILL